MLLVIISLILHCDFFTCVNYEKINFNEDLLMKQHNQNSFQIRAFIKNARHRFHEDTPVSTKHLEKHDTTTPDKSLNYKSTNWWWDNSSFIEQLGLTTPPSFLFPQIRSRPSFPFFITPYTTELNYRHLNWDEIFPETRLRSGSKLSSPQLNRSLPQPTSEASPKNQNGFMSQSPISHSSSRSLPFNTTFRPESSLRSQSGQGFSLMTTTITPNKDYMMWLQEITMYTPVERWLQSLTSKNGVTPSYVTTNHATQDSHTSSKAQTPVQERQIQYYSTDQSPHSLREGLLLSPSPADEEEHRVVTTTTAAPFYTVNVSGIIHLRTATMKSERRTNMNGTPATIAENADTKGTPTTAGLDPKTPGPSRKSRRFYSKARKRKSYLLSHQREIQRPKQYRHRHLFNNEGNIQEQAAEYPMLRRLRKTTEGRRRYSWNTPSLRRKKEEKLRFNSMIHQYENMKNTELTYPPAPTSQYLSQLNDTEDGKRTNLIGQKHNLQYNKTAGKDNPFINHPMKDILKATDEKDKRSKVKAELIRKIVEGSSYSYSDEEETLRRNFIGALRYGNRTKSSSP